MIWKLHQRAEGNVRFLNAFLDAAKRRGFDTFCTDVPWGKVERRRGRFDFSAVEREVRMAVDKGFLLVLKINTSFLKSAIPEWVPETWYMRCKDGSVYRDEVCPNPQLVFTSPELTKRLMRFHRATVRHFEREFRSRGRSPVLFYMSSLTPIAETEYGIGAELDYSEPAQKAFRAWLQEKYGSIAALNERWGTALVDFRSVGVKEYNTTDWFQFRADALGALFRELSGAVRKAARGARYGAQFGSLWDAISWKRATLHAAEWVEYFDWIVIDDAPTYDHRFSCDLARTLAQGRPSSNEIDGDRHPDATDARYAGQASESFAHGATMVDMANWEIELEKGLDHPRWTFLGKLPALASEPVVRPRPTKAIYISTWAQYAHRGVSPSKFVRALYERLTNHGREPIDILVDGVFTRDPSILRRYSAGIYIPAYNTVISDRAARHLRQATVPIFRESRQVGALNEYGDRREFRVGKLFEERAKSSDRAKSADSPGGS
jgi:hypothetical protein